MKEFTLFFAVLIVTSLCLIGCTSPKANGYCDGVCCKNGSGCCCCKDVCCCNDGKCILKD